MVIDSPHYSFTSFQFSEATLTMVASTIQKERSLSFSSTITVQENHQLKSSFKQQKQVEDDLRFEVGSSPDCLLTFEDKPSTKPPLYNGRKRKVQFNKTIQNRRIPHLKDMSDWMCQTIWIQPDEYLDIRLRCRDTILKMAAGTLTEWDLESEEHCPRGLEGKTREGNQRRSEYKLDSIGAVLEEQNLLWNEGVDDDEAIMEVYQIWSIPSAEAAYEVGLQDEDEAWEYLQNGDIYSIQSNKMKNERSDCDADPSTAGTKFFETIKDVVFNKSRRATLLQEIEDNFYQESSIERRRKREEEYSYKSKANASIAESIRDFFFERQGNNEDIMSYDKDEGDMPSLAWEEEESSSSNSSEDSNDSFTTELTDLFHSRKRRQRLLDEIERSYYVEPTIVTEKPSNVAIVSEKLNTSLKSIFGNRSSKSHVLKEIVAAGHR